MLHLTNPDPTLKPNLNEKFSLGSSTLLPAGTDEHAYFCIISVCLTHGSAQQVGYVMTLMTFSCHCFHSQEYALTWRDFIWAGIHREEAPCCACPV